MKAISLTLNILSLFSLLIFSSCEEVGPVIDLTPGSVLKDTTYVITQLPATQHKMVLVEEFTGATCNNCPNGHLITSQLIAEHPDSVIVVAIHNDNPQALPYPNEEDFRTAEGIQISQKLGGSAAIPSAAINRRIFPGETQEVIFLNKWKNYTTEELKTPPRINLTIESDFNASSREVIVTATAVFLENVDSTTNLSIMITESDIISPQKLVDLSTDYNYVHNHVLRDMITPAFGVGTNTTTEKGRVVIKQFSYTLPANWNENNVEIVGLIHFFGNSNLVLQSAHTKVK